MPPSSSSSQQEQEQSQQPTNNDEQIIWIKSSLLTSLINSPSSNNNSTTQFNSQEEELLHASLTDDFYYADSQDDDAKRDWGWTRAQILSSSSEEMEVLICDEDCLQYNDRKIYIPTSSIVKSTQESNKEEEEVNLVIANPWEHPQAATLIYQSERSSDDDDDDDIHNPEEEMYPSDLITLTHLHEPSIIFTLRRRYELDIIYTATGPILLALNPFKYCAELYEDETLRKYKVWGEHKEELKEEVEDVNPHVYKSADVAFRSMMRGLSSSSTSSSSSSPSKGGAAAARRRRMQKDMGMVEEIKQPTNQSLLVSGESGAGKTVTTRHIMRYLATLSQDKHGGGGGEMKKESENDNQSIEQKILESNPILETFGNARTIRNDNSSRFGKFIELQFTPSGKLTGASIETYLLEKVRLITQNYGERNYHVFYELLCGVEDEDYRETIGLGGWEVEDFDMVQGENVGRRDGVDDYDQFQLLLESMDTMGFTKEEQTSIFTTISSILHLLNLNFTEINSDECSIDNSNPHLQPTVDLLGLGEDEGENKLNTALTSFTIQVRGNNITRKLNKHKAEKGLNALAKATYAALFDYIVQSVNRSIHCSEDGNDDHGVAEGGKTSSSSAAAARRRNVARQNSKRNLGVGSRKSAAAAFIGVLDIFGFESFAINSFEQLCINYCNEALQQQFNRFVFKVEQLEYQREGIKWSFIEFPDNQDVLDLIDKKKVGIISLLDDQCKTPSTTDKTFATSIYKTCKPHSRFQASHRQVGLMKFGVKHYAGPVEYNIEGFMEKNKDELPREAADLLLSSDKAFVKMLAKIMTEHSSSPSSSSSASSTMSPGGAARRAPPSSPSSSSASATRPTVGGQFASQLRSLREKIDTTAPHYIRCLKPNEELLPDDFDPALIADQLRSAGVLEAVRVSRVGFPQRYTHFQFVKRYGCLAPNAMKSSSTRDVKRQCMRVVEKVATEIWKDTTNPSLKAGAKITVDPSDVGIQVGKTKVFLRQHVFEHLERYRSRKKEQSCILIQAIARRYVHRRAYLKTLQDVRMVQSLVRKIIGTKEVQELREQRAATRMQRVWRRHDAQSKFVRMMWLTSWCQRTWRGRNGRLLYRSLDQERRSIVIQRSWRRYWCYNRYGKQKDSALIVQCFVRCSKSRQELKQLKLGARDLAAVKKELERVKAELAAAKMNQSTTVTISHEGEAEEDARRKEYEEEARQAKEELEKIKRAAAEEAEKSRAELARIQKEIEEAKRKHDAESELLLTFPPPQPKMETTNEENVVMVSEDEAKLLEEMKKTKEKQEKAQAESLALKKELEEVRLSFMCEIKSARGESETLRQKLAEMNDNQSAMKSNDGCSESEMELFKAEIERLSKELEEKEQETQRMEDIILDMTQNGDDSEDDSSEESSYESELSGSVEMKNTQFWTTVDDIKKEPARSPAEFSDSYKDSRHIRDDQSNTASLSIPSSVSRGMSIQFDSVHDSVGSITYDSSDTFIELQRQIEVLRSELSQRNIQSEDVQSLAEDSRRNMQELQSLREELKDLKRERNTKRGVDAPRLETVSEEVRDAEESKPREMPRDDVQRRRKKNRAPKMTCFWAPLVRSWLNNSSMSQSGQRPGVPH